MIAWAKRGDDLVTVPFSYRGFHIMPSRQPKVIIAGNDLVTELTANFALPCFSSHFINMQNKAYLTAVK